MSQKTEFIPESGSQLEDNDYLDQGCDIDDGEDDNNYPEVTRKDPFSQSTIDPASYHEFYERNIQNYIELALSMHDNKHNFLVQSKYGQVHHTKLHDHCSLVKRHGHKADFSIIILIRYLYFKNENVTPYRDELELLFHDFSFWTGNIEIDQRRQAMQKTIFWSENHIFMYLSSAYLSHQYFTENSSSHTPSCCVNYHDLDLLMIYLESHCHPNFNGVYEVLSCTYLPWTICSLLNLYDFASDLSVKALSKTILDQIITTFCLVATRDGICNLTASTRQYQNLRTRTWNHNINQLIYLITGKVHDPLGVKLSPLGDFLATSTYRPPENILENYFNFHGSIVRMKMNHLTKETREVYRASRGARAIDDVELTPFYWSSSVLPNSLIPS